MMTHAESVENFREKVAPSPAFGSPIKPTKKRVRRAAETWAVVEMPDGSKQAYTSMMKAIHVAQEAGVARVALCRISPKTRGFKVLEMLEVGA